MKLNKFNCLGILLVLVVFTFPVISAATTLVSPEASSSNSGTFIINCTTAVSDALNVTIYYNATGGDTMAIALTTIVNTTDGQTEFYDYAVSISSLTDGASYNFTCYADSGISQEYSAGSILTIDNTAPLIDLYVLYDGTTQSFDGILDYRCTLSDAIDSTLSTQSFSVAHPSGDETSSTTLTRDSSSNVQFMDTDYAGDYVFTCSATDAAGNTGTSSSTVTIDELGNVIGLSKSGKNGNTNMLLVIVGLVVAFFLLKKD